MSRMAGMAGVESYLASGPDLGRLGQKAAVNDAKFNIAGMEAESLVGATALGEYGDTAAASLTFPAKGNMYEAQAKAEMMKTAGALGGNMFSLFSKKA